MIDSLDTRLKLFQLVLLAALAFAASSVLSLLTLALGAALMLALEGAGKRGVRFFFIYAILLGLTVYLEPWLESHMMTLVLLYLAYFVLTFLPVMTVFFTVTARTEVSRLIHALTTLRIPRVLVLPIAVVFRFVPALLEEWGHIRDAMRLRGLQFGGRSFLRHPLLSLELLLVPLIMRSVKIADELAASAMTRCIDAPVRKTTAHPLRFRRSDYAVWALTLLWAAAVIAANYWTLDIA